MPTQPKRKVKARVTSAVKAKLVHEANDTARQIVRLVEAHAKKELHFSTCMAIVQIVGTAMHTAIFLTAAKPARR